MNAVRKIDLRQRLLNRRQRLQNALGEFKETTQLMRLLKEVDSALERMNGDSYGLCQVCHEAIEEERLIADPLVQNCLGCLTPDQQRALEQDLDLASRIQTQLLPNKNLKLNGWEAYYHYEPAGPVSGDYCDLVTPEAETGDLFFLLGDVSGHGVAASLLMSHLHAAFRSLLAAGLSAGQLVEPTESSVRAPFPQTTPPWSAAEPISRERWTSVMPAIALLFWCKETRSPAWRLPAFPSAYFRPGSTRPKRCNWRAATAFCFTPTDSPRHRIEPTMSTALNGWPNW